MGGVWPCGLLLMSAATACGAFVAVTPVAGPRSVRRAPATCSLPPSAAAHLEFAADARPVRKRARGSPSSRKDSFGQGVRCASAPA